MKIKLLKSKIFLLAIILLAFFGLAENSWATDTHLAVDCTRDKVSDAIGVADYGDIVQIPAGSCEWTSLIEISSNKKIILQGAGYDNTVITSHVPVLDLSYSGSRVTGIGFMHTSADVIKVQGKNWRIDNCKFNNIAGASLATIRVTSNSVDYHPAGVIDNNIFIQGRIGVAPFNMDSAGYKGRAVWAESSFLGTENTVFIEDNSFYKDTMGGIVDQGGNVVDANYGGHYVFRYNTVSGPTQLMNHGLGGQATGPYVGSPGFEIYGNSFISGTTVYNTAIYQRSGTAIIFNNTQSNHAEGIWKCGVPRVDSTYCAGIPDGGCCDGDSSWDANVPGENGWYCREQIGVGQPDKWAWTVSNPYPPQTRQPVYLFLNSDSKIQNVNPAHIKNNRDYYLETYLFDGTLGVGVGTLANRPATCMAGVGYWATDQGTWNTKGEDGILYQCGNSNNWVKYYEPYTYPHPLRNENPFDSVPPSAPSGLSVR